MEQGNEETLSSAMEGMGLVSASPLSAEVYAFLAFLALLYAVPMLIALALTYRLVKKQTQTYVYVGLLAALLWTVWTLTDPFGVQTSTLLRQNSLLVSALLYLSALIDWSRSLLKSRLTVFDWLTTCVFCLCLVSLAAFFWLN